MKLFRTPDTLMKAVPDVEGGVFTATAQGLREPPQAVRRVRYIDAVTEPTFGIIPNTDKIDPTLSPKRQQFFVRRIDYFAFYPRQ